METTKSSPSTVTADDGPRATGSAPDDNGCCEAKTVATPSTPTQVCCGTVAEAQAANGCCGSAARAEAVASGAGSCH